MKNGIYYSLLLISLLFLGSCEGMRVADGKVVDKTTNNPLDSVLCRVIETDELYYTDSDGKYYLEGPFGGCVRKCKDMTVEFSKDGYQTISITNPGTETIELEN